jgi:hypothetical protein
MTRIKGHLERISKIVHPKAHKSDHMLALPSIIISGEHCCTGVPTPLAGGHFDKNAWPRSMSNPSSEKLSGLIKEKSVGRTRYLGAEQVGFPPKDVKISSFTGGSQMMMIYLIC